MQYQLPAYRKLLEQLTLSRSMSRRGNCLVNAAMESFFGKLKTEISGLDSIRLFLKL
jgi:putative transposase